MTGMTKKFLQSRIVLIGAFLCLLCAFAIVQYYIWGPPYITEFHADCTDTLFWANSTLESEKLFKPTFSYAYRLVFGGQWLFIGFIRLFGIGMRALRCGMCLFSIIFTLALLFFFSSLKWSWASVLFDSSMMLLAACATMKTREIFFGHVIHYSLSILYLLIAFGFFFRSYQGTTRGKRIILLFLYISALLMCSMNGSVQVLFVTLPILGGCLIEFCLNGDRNLLWYAAGAICTAGAGMVYARFLNTNYSDSYSVLVPSEDWGVNIGTFFTRWVSLFYSLPSGNFEAISDIGIKTIFKTTAAILTIVGGILSFRIEKNQGKPQERIFVYSCWTQWLLFMFFFIFGKISNVNWRLIPVIFSAQMALIVMLRNLPEKQKDVTVSSLLTFGCGVIFILHCLSNGLSVLRLPYDDRLWFAEDGMIETLRTHGLTDGYITNYWLTNNVTVLTDNEIRPRYVMMTESGPDILLFNSDLDWYEDRPGVDRYFFIMPERDYDPESELAKGSLETFSFHQEEKRNMTNDDYIVMVFDHNLLKDSYDRMK